MASCKPLLLCEYCIVQSNQRRNILNAGNSIKNRYFSSKTQSSQKKFSFLPNQLFSSRSTKNAIYYHHVNYGKERFLSTQASAKETESAMSTPKMLPIEKIRNICVVVKKKQKLPFHFFGYQEAEASHWVSQLYWAGILKAKTISQWIIQWILGSCRSWNNNFGW